jgi:hypothetical protein
VYWVKRGLSRKPSTNVDRLRPPSPSSATG